MCWVVLRGGWSGCAEQCVLDIQGSGARREGQATNLYFHPPTNQPSKNAKSPGLRNLAKSCARRVGPASHDRCPMLHVITIIK